MAILFGFLGLLVAVPLLATVMVMVQVLYVEQNKAGVPEGAAESSGGFDADLDEALEGAPAR
jgi:predicted PurR-regulated permease PerM